MTKTLPKTDPNLIKAVDRLGKAHTLYGWLLISLGLFAQWSAGVEHPLAGMPFIAIGIAELVLGEPVLLGTVGLLIILSVLPTLYPTVTILGPEPLVTMMDLGGIEKGALVLGKVILAGTALNQFFLFRLLYGTETATSDDPNLPIIPPMIPNRTDRLARTAQWAGIFSNVAIGLALLLFTQAPDASATRLMTEMAGSLGATAFGLGLATAFSPTTKREAALWGVGTGMVGYLTAVFTLMRFLA